MGKINIRKVTQRDKPAIARLLEKIPEYTVEERRQIRSMFERKNYHHFIAEKTRNLVGAGTIFKLTPEIAYLTHMFVRPRQLEENEIADKLRQALLQHAFEELGAQSVHANAKDKESVEKARKVFEALGFSKKGKYVFSITREKYFELKNAGGDAHAN